MKYHNVCRHCDFAIYTGVRQNEHTIFLHAISPWKQFESLGRLADHEKSDIACSMELLKNGDLSEDLTKSITKARLPMAESNSLVQCHVPSSQQVLSSLQKPT